jgi:uncharacterized protein with von Willebrand factor type A (vWA) domain
MTRRAARIIWLNPEPLVMWQDNSDMPQYAPLSNYLSKVGNLKELADAVDSLPAG